MRLHLEAISLKWPDRELADMICTGGSDYPPTNLPVLWFEPQSLSLNEK